MSGQNPSTLLPEVDSTSADNSAKNTPAFSQRAIHLADSLYNQILLFESKLPATSRVTQIIDYDKNKKINITYFFIIEKIYKDYLQYKRNHILEDASVPGWKGLDFGVPDSIVCARFLGQLNIYFRLDSVQVRSPFPGFNQRFGDYLLDRLMVYRAVSDMLKDTSKNFQVLSYKLMCANEDNAKDLLVFDVGYERIGNALTDFWLYDPAKAELIEIDELSQPIWEIEEQKRVFTAGWHHSASDWKTTLFKIKGKKAVIIGQSGPGKSE